MNLNAAIIYAIPVFFVTMGIELVAGYVQKKKYYSSLEDTITNLNIGIGSEAFAVFTKAIMLGVYAIFYEKFALISLPVNLWTGIICLIMFDFIYYWAHRWGHEWNFFWAAHIVHHQSQEYNLSVALRQSWIHTSISFFMFLPLALFGFQPMLLAGVLAFATLYQYWIHTKLINRLPAWFEFVFNAPSHHRVHHGINPQYLDKNYAAVFIIWDRIFEVVYGTTEPINSWNPVWANVHFYVEMVVGAKNLKSIGDKFKLVFQGPAYLGKLLGQTKVAENYHTIQEKYQTKTGLPIQIYVLIQHLLLSGGLVLFMLNCHKLVPFAQFGGFCLIIFTTLTLGGLLESKVWAKWMEGFRLICVGVFLINIF
jgi:alkylglycerol monooxygenase